jgi:rubredoxin
MTKYRCTICGWVYDPYVGVPEEYIKPGTPFENIHDKFRCPQCGAMKKWFEALKE